MNISIFTIVYAQIAIFLRIGHKPPPIFGHFKGQKNFWTPNRVFQAFFTPRNDVFRKNFGAVLAGGVNQQSSKK